MNLWWFQTSAERCSFSELQKRKTLAFGWSELGDISRYIKDKPGWERQFKTYIQVKGDVVFVGNSKWRDGDRHIDVVPSLVWQFLQLKKGDLIAVIETGNRLAYGRPMVRGVGQLSEDGMSSYRFEEGATHGHCVGGEVEWLEWNAIKMGELTMPKQSFRVLCQDNERLDVVQKAFAQTEPA